MGDRVLHRASGAGGDSDCGCGSFPPGRVGGALGVREVGDRAAANPEARTLESRVYQVVRRELVDARRPYVTAGGIYLLMGNLPLESVYIALKGLRRKGLLRFAGAKRMELAPGAPACCDDGRGHSPGSVQARQAIVARRRNTRASMGTSRPVRGRAIVTE